MSACLDRGQLFDTAPCGLLLLDGSFRILASNRYFRELAGISEEAATDGLNLKNLLSVAGRIFLQTRLQQELALAGRVEELALDLVTPERGRVPVMLNASQALDDSGRPGEIQISVWRAIAKRAYEAEVPKARLAAAQAGRVKADFLANISHEIRTPLNGVIGVAAVMSTTALTAEQRQMLDVIRSSGETLERLVSDVLDISKVQAGALELETRPFDLLSELDGVFEAAGLRATEKGLTFEWTCSAEVPGRYEGDAVRVKQLLGNIIFNALKFTTVGTVKVEANIDADGALTFRISDTGIGFDQARASELFVGFEQADTGITREHGGAGLGLSISKALVELMGGDIAAHSEVGAGSTFTVRIPLPRLPDAPISLVAAEVEDERLEDKPLRVLLVEDNPTNQKVVQMILGAIGVDLVIADNGRLGVDAWADGRFDLVLMDMQMPVMDGLSAIREIRKIEAGDLELGRTPIAVLSANAMEHHRREALEAGADIHLSKPVTPQSLVSGMQMALEATG